MQTFDLRKTSEMVSHAGYEVDSRTLFLTFTGGPTTIAYYDVCPELVKELRQAEYPDTCIRFRVQAEHAFRRLQHPHVAFDLGFVK